ncbi:MAG: hypothetical protein R3185_04640 [Candidatus Thermoplasmatota archaeon]|nr:hypothetical protein [Candidatus Thermoplasmatota archaeon]
MTDPAPQADGRRREDEFSWPRRNWQFITALAAVLATGVGVYYRTGALEHRLTELKKDTAADIEKVNRVNGTQWELIGDLRDRVSKVEGHH